MITILGVYNATTGSWCTYKDQRIDFKIREEPLSITISTSSITLLLEHSHDKPFKIYMRNLDVAVKYWDYRLNNWGRLQITLDNEHEVNYYRIVFKNAKVLIIEKDKEMDSQLHIQSQVSQVNPTVQSKSVDELTDPQLIETLRSKINDENFKKLVGILEDPNKKTKLFNAILTHLLPGVIDFFRWIELI